MVDFGVLKLTSMFALVKAVRGYPRMLETAAGSPNNSPHSLRP